MSTYKEDTEDGVIIADLSRKLTVAQAEPKVPKILDGAPYIVLRDADGNERAEQLLGRLPAPHRKHGTVKLFDVDSFIWYYKEHGNGAPVYATLEPAQFLAVLNEHTKDAAGYRDYRADFTVKHSKEWQTWVQHNGHGAAFNSTDSFALFLEEQSLDIVKPDAATMLQIALNFRLSQDVQFKQVTRLQDGQIDFGYSTVINAEAKQEGGRKLQIPEVFTIEVPVFDGPTQPRYRVDARFRYRLSEGKLKLWYELVRPHKVVQDAFKAIWDRIVKETKAPILLGRPE